MKIEQLTLRQFRNHASLELRPYEGINLFFGKNGAGKTNILEAIHYCALGRSHRVNNDHDVVMAGTEMAACGCRVAAKTGKTDVIVKLTPAEKRKKTVFIDQKKAERLSDLMGHLRCVIFSPEDLELIKEGPGTRRKFLDMMLSQINTSYFIALQEYRSYLEQKNSALREMKYGGSRDDGILEIFDRKLSALAEMITAERENFTKMLSVEAARIYHSISGGKEEILSVTYQSSVTGKSAEQIYDLLVKGRDSDIRYGMTETGPHRDDLLIRLNEKNMKVYASQGQIRTAALSIKLAELKVFEKICGEPPVLLLDDVMSELDMERRLHLLDEIRHVQTFITCTDETDVQDEGMKQVYSILSDDGKATVRLTDSGDSEAVKFEEPDFY
ncbi:MAG: DNA replication/repair protein RecF [Clostridia bacterium]|nr:DNA replication/repair protein RecF [Clostridia bacterium]